MKIKFYIVTRGFKIKTLTEQEKLLQLILQTGQGRNEQEEAENVLTAFLDIFDCTSGSLIKMNEQLKGYFSPCL